jgi:Rad3-related DNA helicase
MATIELNSRDLLKAVHQLAPNQLDAFLDQALALGHRQITERLSATESRFIQRINRGIPEAIAERYEQLRRKSKRRTLQADDQSELLGLTHKIEARDAERAADLLELAKLRSEPVRMLRSGWVWIQTARPFHEPKNLTAFGSDHGACPVISGL